MEHLTEDELIDWENRHDEVISWLHRWTLLSVILSSACIATVVFSDSVAAWLVMLALALIALVMQRRYINKDAALHLEMNQKLDGEDQ